MILKYEPTMLIEFDYALASFDAAAVERIGTNFRALLEAIPGDPERRLDDEVAAAGQRKAEA